MTAAPGTLTSLIAVSVILTGCSAEAEDPGLLPAEPSTVTIYEYAQTKDGYRLAPVTAKVPERLEGQSSFTSDAMRGVATLLDHTPASENRHTLWNGDCAPGGEVTEVEITQTEISVRLDEWNGMTCDVDQGALDARDQQIAWTVIINSKADLVMPPFPEIVVHDASGVTWDPITPDGSYLPQGGEY